MPRWLKKVRGALGMGVVWAVAWAVIGGAIMEGIIDRDGKMMDMWPQFLGIVGFLGGVVFSTVLGIAARKRRFDQLSVPQFAGFGALGGVALGVLGMATGGPLVFLAVTTIGCAVAATGTLVIARKAAGHTALGIGDSDTELESVDVQERIGRGK